MGKTRSTSIPVARENSATKTRYSAKCLAPSTIFNAPSFVIFVAGPVAFALRPMFFNMRKMVLGSVSRFVGPLNHTKLKKCFFRKNLRTSRPAAAPHRKPDRIRMVRAVGPRAAL